MLPMAHPSPHLQRHLDRFSHFLHSSRQNVAILFASFSPYNYPFPCGSRLQSDTWFFGPIRSPNPNGIAISSAVLEQVTPECPYFTRPLKTEPSHGKCGPHVICGSLRPPDSSTKMASPSLHPFLQGSLVQQTDRQIDRPTYHAPRSVTTGCIFVRSTGAMRPLCYFEDCHKYNYDDYCYCCINQSNQKEFYCS